MTNFLELLSLFEALQTGIYQEQGGALGTLAGVSDSSNDYHICMVAIGDKNFGAVKNPVVSVFYRIGAYTLNVRAGAGLSHGQSAHRFARDHFGQPLLFLFLGTEVLNIGGNNIAVNAPAGGDAAIAHAGQFFYQGQGDVGAGAGPAVFLGHVRAQQTGFTQRVPKRPGHQVIFFPLLKVRANFLLKSTACHVAKQG